MQKWDYAWIRRVREFRGTLTGSATKDWEWSGGNTKTPGVDWGGISAKDTNRILEVMGEAGWELVNIVAGSHIGGTGSAGFTSEETFYFKRPTP